MVKFSCAPKSNSSHLLSVDILLVCLFYMPIYCVMKASQEKRIQEWKSVRGTGLDHNTTRASTDHMVPCDKGESHIWNSLLTMVM